MNYFELFNIPKKYIIDQSLLQKNYLSLQVKYHPDKANDLEKRTYLEYSILANEAFKTLKDNYLRASYMLKLHGQAFDDSALKNVLSQTELEKILQQHELIEELDDLVTLKGYKEDNYSQSKKVIDALGLAFDNNNITEALDLTVRLKYLTNLAENIKLKIKQLA